MNYKKKVILALNKEIKEKLDENVLELPPNESLGDYALPCFILSKKLKKSPIEIAKKLESKKFPSIIEKTKAVGPYLNIYLNRKHIIKEIFKEKENYGKGNKKEKIMIEFSNPNPFKGFHIGHLRNTVLGESISRLLKFQGNKVIPVNYYNDTGKHVAKCLWGLENLKVSKPEDKDLGEWLGKIYSQASIKGKEEEFSIIHKKLEEKDKKYTKAFKQGLSWSEEHFNNIYKDLNITFSKIYYDSDYLDTGKKIVNNLIKKKVAKLDEGAIIADLEKYKLNTLILTRSDGTSMYITKDLSMAIDRINKFKLDSSVYVVGSEQKLHFQQLFKLLELYGYKQSKKCYHLSYGLVNLPEGSMSSRSGNIVLYKDLKRKLFKLLDEEINKRHNNKSKSEKQKIKEDIFSAAIRFDMVLPDTNKEITFDIKKSICFEGDTGPYIQYAHTRASSILKKSKEKISDKINYRLLSKKEEQNLISKLALFPEITKNAAEQHKPNIVAQYLLRISHLFSDFYHNCPCISEDKDLEKARLLLVFCTKQILSSGLYLLGINSPEEM
ncbi:arginine--tRNA ligase [Candidatus Woesearchaeota archaeon]|jgi:arginyl-tRNA synthetase|nr:arginine--tRNA ligase [Candidatus Woesearchaeota archaeon]MBT4322139.1 arginine--tRNA ligase [Candidatus Woesearchaeota archaeon]MBT4630975.1 arginine--tRNA ligase [Candidatus Woesearchaeota archaeon]